jgi:hypothetical protein
MIDLAAGPLAIVRRLLAAQVPECEVRAFGSRVTGGAKPYPIAPVFPSCASKIPAVWVPVGCFIPNQAQPPIQMNPKRHHSSLLQAFHPAVAALAVAVLTGSAGHAPAQLVLANPNWNITLTNFGYSDFLLDNTPGFEGREYLSGEWGAAVGYTTGGGTVTPQWLEPNFSYPDWVTNSTFHVVAPITLTGVLNADGLPIAESVIANADLQITLRYEMLDTVTGTPMGGAPASAGGTGASLMSSRYVLKQTYTIKNISAPAAAISNLQLFQLLHGLQSQRGLYDNRTYAGPLSEYRYDVTQAGVDAWAVGAGSSTAGLEDFIGLHAKTAASGFELGYYGIEGNGIDNHGSGKPSEGVHLSIEDNWQTTRYSARLGTDEFTPPQRWVAGAERWDLGNLAADATVTHEVLLSVRTGTKVVAGTGSTGGCNGGAGVPGGLDYQFETVTTEGSCFAGFSRANEAELATRIAAGEFNSFTFLTPGGPAQVWEVAFSGTYSGAVNLTLSYDASLLPAGFDETSLAVNHFSGEAWHTLPDGVVDPLTHTIAFSTSTLGPFALGVAGTAITFLIDASEAPANSGTVTGAGTYAQAAGVTLVAAPNPGYVFANWTEGGAGVSTSPSYTFAASAARTLVANFVAVGDAKAISTSSSPSSAGATNGGGAYALNTDATVVATANPGYKFSKWTVDGVKVSATSTYGFTVTADRALVAVFKPVYSVTVTHEPAGEFEVQADSPAYEPGDKVTMEVNHMEPDFSFVNWTENGVPVSTLAGFTFNITGNRQLVANFAPGSRVDLLADPKTAGQVRGGGVFEASTPVTVTAEPLPGYIFLEWTDAGGTVSTQADYTFTTAVPLALTARFIALPKIAMVPAAEPGKLVISWPDAAGWVLQESGDLAGWAATTRTITTLNGQRSVTVDTGVGLGFFRLKYQ